ncbi:MAG: sigma-70 family RNA polymerase sigma factor [Solirubrobacteraceae bacterium]
MPDPSATASHGAHDPAQPSDAHVRVQLKMLHDARARGDREAAKRAWVWIISAESQRVRGIARGFRHHALPGGRIPDHDIDDIAAEVFMRLHGKVDQLQGRSVGELRAFLRTATDYACKDYVRAHVVDDRRRAGSIDDTSPDGQSTATERALSEIAARMAADDEEAEIARAVVHPALGLVDEDKRAVLMMDQAGASVEEIMERFGISRDNVYQRRRRGLKQLRDAILELAEEDGGA